MTRRAASGPAVLRARRRGLMLAVPIALVALAVAAFALAPTSIGHPANGRTDERLLPPLSRASVPAPAIHVPVAVAGAAVSGGERALPGRGARSGGGAWSDERCGGCS